MHWQDSAEFHTNGNLCQCCFRMGLCMRSLQNLHYCNETFRCFCCSCTSSRPLFFYFSRKDCSCRYCCAAYLVQEMTTETWAQFAERKRDSKSEIKRHDLHRLGIFRSILLAISGRARLLCVLPEWGECATCAHITHCISSEWRSGFGTSLSAWALTKNNWASFKDLSDVDTEFHQEVFLKMSNVINFVTWLVDRRAVLHQYPRCSSPNSTESVGTNTVPRPVLWRFRDRKATEVVCSKTKERSK